MLFPIDGLPTAGGPMGRINFSSNGTSQFTNGEEFERT